MIVLIGDVNPVLIIDGEPGGKPKLAVLASKFSEEEKKLSLRIEDLNIVEARIDDINMPLRIDADPFWKGELTETGPDASELG